MAGLAWGPASAGEGKQAFSARGESRITVEPGGRVRTVTRSFRLVRPPNPDGYGSVSIVLDETVDTTEQSGIEGYESRWVRTKLVDPGQPGRRDARRIEAEGAGTRIEDHLYAVMDPGCCGALNGGHFFSLYTGKKLFVASGGDLGQVRAELTVLSLPRHVRHLAVHSPGAADDHRVYGREDVAHSPKPIVVTWASWKEPIMRMLITGPPRSQAARGEVVTEPPFRVERVEWEDPENPRWPRRKSIGYDVQDRPVDPEAIGGVAVLLHFAGGAVARVPIEADRIDIERVRLPAGMAARIEAR